MKILLEAHHPAHIHFWKYPVRELIERGHEVLGGIEKIRVSPLDLPSIGRGMFRVVSKLRSACERATP